MCGIYAIIPTGTIQREEVIGISNYLSHRGPDEDAILLVKNIFDESKKTTHDYKFHYGDSIKSIEKEIDVDLILGHRRLSIIDLSPLGRQPMLFLDRYWIIFNGEIYNYIELKEDLAKIGFQFSTNTDTEVILAAYHYWGEECLNKFNGMWAIIIYDSVLNTLFIARDRFGVKPLYYRVSESGLVLASEIKAFTALSDWNFKINEKRLIDYLVWNIQDHTCETLFHGVFQIEAGSYAKINLVDIRSDILIWKGKKLNNIVKWYNIENKFLECNKSDNVNQLKKLLKSSIKLRLRSDVQVGACLSGGIDSSTIASIIGKELNKDYQKKFKTITAGSDHSKFDERYYANIVNRKYNFIGNEVIVDDVDLFKELDKVIWHQDEPFSSTSTYAQWKVFESAKLADIKVMLDGQGADEIFCGYPGFFGPYLASLIKKGEFLSYIQNFWNLYKKNKIQVSKIIGYTLGYLFPLLLRRISKYDGKSYGNLNWIKAEYRREAKIDPFVKFGSRESLRHMSYAQVQNTNLPMLLHWEDRNSMAFSIEARVPFLDFRIVEFALGLDDNAKIDKGVTKKILREAAFDYVPNDILKRRDKMGFVTAEPEWMKGDMKLKFRDELLQARKNFEFLLDETLIKMFDEFCSGTKKYDNFFWRIICANRWFELFNEKKYKKWE